MSNHTTTSTTAAAESKSYKGGPRTLEGKARSSRNALKHGLRVEKIMVGSIHDHNQELFRRYHDQFQPQNDAENLLIIRAARASLLAEMAAEVLEKLANDRAVLDLRDWKASHRKRIRRIAQDLGADPNRTVARLEMSAFGIDWMLKHWETLRGRLVEGRAWTAEQTEHALRGNLET